MFAQRVPFFGNLEKPDIHPASQITEPCLKRHVLDTFQPWFGMGLGFWICGKRKGRVKSRQASLFERLLVRIAFKPTVREISVLG